MKWKTAAELLALLVLIAVLVWRWSGTSVMATATIVAIYSIVTLGLVMLTGFAGQLSLGHGALMGLGAYAYALLTTRAGLDPLAALIAGTIIVGVASYLLGRVILGLSGFYFALATLAIASVVDSVLVGWLEVTGGPSGLTGIPTLSLFGFVVDRESGYFLVTCALLIPTLASVRQALRSRPGRVLRVIDSDENLAVSLGIDPTATKRIVFAISGSLAGLGGGLYAGYFQFVSPGQFALHTSFELLLVVLVGGPLSVYGAVVGALFLKMLPEWAAPLSDWRIVLYGAVYVVASLYMRTGIVGMLQEMARRITRLLQNRHKGVPQAGASDASR